MRKQVGFATAMMGNKPKRAFIPLWLMEARYTLWFVIMAS
jgi:hypothetical protein